MASVRSRVRWLALSVVLFGCFAPAEPDGKRETLRLVDLTPADYHVESIDGMQKRILDRVPTNIIPLPDRLPTAPVLVVDVGLARMADSVTVRFDVVWKPAEGPEEVLSSVERREPGWSPVRIDLSSRHSRGAALVFRRSVVAGSPTGVGWSFWGDPVIVSLRTRIASAMPSVILISLDTLRADRVGLYGCAEAHTPVLDKLGRTGVWYEQAYSTAGWTVPSHTGLLYGTHLPFAPADPPAPEAATLQPRALAEVLREHGWLTAGFTGGGWMSSGGLSRGFDTFYAFPQLTPVSGECRAERFDGKTVFGEAANWLRNRGLSPFFMLVHTYDIHDRCPFGMPNVEGFGPWSPDAKTADLMAFYDQLIAATDGLVGQLLSELDQLDLSRSTMIVVTSDHGEFFNEHGLQNHGCVQKPYEELMHVPLIVHDPTARHRASIGEPVSLVDVAPTILSLLHVPVPAAMNGSILPGLGLKPSPRREPVYSVCDDMAMLRDGPDKLMMSRSGAFSDEVYELVDDPGETTNLAADTKRLTRLRALADGVVALRPLQPGAPGAPTPAVDEGTKERLRALGY